MSTTYTTNLGLTKAALNTGGWDAILNAILDQLDALTPVGALACRPNETPTSTSLVVRVGGGTYRKPDGTLGTFSTSTITATASSTNYIYLDSSYSLNKSTTSFPASGAYVPIAVVVAGSSTITSVADSRLGYLAVGAGTGYLPSAGGTLSDGANVQVGTTTGTQLATATSQKLGFYGATPIVQPSGANEVAIGSLSMTSVTVTSVGATNSSDQSTTINSNFNSINTQLSNGAADFAAIKVLLNEIRAQLVNLGLWKGSS